MRTPISISLSKAKKSTVGKCLMLAGIALLTVLMVKLGFWQLARAEYKTRMLEVWQRPAQTLSVDSQPGQKVVFSGRIVKQHYLLLDNRTRAGKAGYEVLALVQPELKQPMIVVNLGWHQADSDRALLPQLVLPANRIEFEGWLKPVRKNFVLAEAPWSKAWPKRVQSLTPHKLAMAFERDVVFSALLLQEKPLLEGLVTQWKAVGMSPQRHKGYAVQWFALALTLLLLTVWFCRRQRSGGEANEV
ncbi:MAG: SURF1 family protein [Pseudomonadales bacterium]